MGCYIVRTVHAVSKVPRDIHCDPWLVVPVILEREVPRLAEGEYNRIEVFKCEECD